MINQRHPPAPLRLFGVVAATLAAFVGPAFAGDRVVLDTAVTAERLVIEVDSADIQVFLEAADDALLRATAPATSPEAPLLTVGQQQGDAVVRRTLFDGASGPRLRFDLLVPPQMRLRIAGRDLSIQIEPATLSEDGAGGESDAPPHSETTGLMDRRAEIATLPQSEVTAPPHAEAIAAQGGSDGGNGPEVGGSEPAQSLGALDRGGSEVQPRFELDLVDSELIAHSIGHIAGKAKNSTLTLIDTTYSVSLDLTGCAMEIREHQGLVELRLQSGEALVASAHGSHQISAALGATVEIAEGRGQLETHLESDSRLRADGFKGQVSIEGTQSLIEGRRLWSTPGGIDIKGDELDLVLEDCRGPFEANLHGGRLSAVGLVGKSRVTGLRGAQIDLEDLNGRLGLWLRTGSAGRVSEARGLIEANIEGSTLEIEDSQRLDLTAKDGEVGVRGLQAIAGFRAQGSRLDLDLTALHANKPVLHLLSQTRGAIRLASPCLVQIRSADPLGASNVEVSGCETKRYGEGTRGRAPTRIDGSRMTWLTVDIAPDARIEIDGS